MSKSTDPHATDTSAAPDSGPQRPPIEPSRFRPRNPIHLIIVVAAFAASRLVLIAGGLRFRADPPGQIHLLSLDALRDDPFVAITSLHIQPPLFNFFVGAVLRWSPFAAGISFQLLYLAAGLTTALALWTLLRNLGAEPWMATVATTLVILNPLGIRDETILTYETPVAAMLVLTALACERYLRRPDAWRLGAFAAILVVGVLTRTTLNPLWFLGALALVVILRRPRASRGASLAITAGAVVLVAAPIVHNAVSFQTVGLSSYAGQNFSRITVRQLPQDRLDELIEAGKLSPSAAVVAYSRYQAFAPYFPPCHPDTGKPVLDRHTKTSNDRPNLNSLCYLPVDHQAMRDAIKTLRAEPGTYVGAVGVATMLYVSAERHFAEPDSPLWQSWTKAYSPILVPVDVHYSFGGSDPQPYTRVVGQLAQSNQLSLTIIFALLLSLGYGIRGVLRALKQRADHVDRTRIFIGFMVLTVTIVSVMFDTFENARFRAPLDPILLGPLYLLALTFCRTAVLATRRRFMR